MPIDTSYIDFTYNGQKASDFHLVRVSSSSRYNDNLLPTLNDKTTDIPGADGMYFFNTYYKQKSFTINFAYDSVTETDLRAIRNWLNGRDVHELVFDEQPDRIYFAKVTGAPSLKYIPFDSYEHRSNNTDAQISGGSSTSIVIYKGEGTATFTCYDPFAYSAPVSLNLSTNTTAIGGELQTPVTIAVAGTVAANNSITITSAGITIATITLLEEASGISWQGRTGMVTGTVGGITRPLQFSGNSMIAFSPDMVPRLAAPNGASATLTYRKRYY